MMDMLDIQSCWLQTCPGCQSLLPQSWTFHSAIYATTTAMSICAPPHHLKGLETFNYFSSHGVNETEVWGLFERLLQQSCNNENSEQTPSTWLHENLYSFVCMLYLGLIITALQDCLIWHYTCGWRGRRREVLAIYFEFGFLVCPFAKSHLLYCKSQ